MPSTQFQFTPTIPLWDTTPAAYFRDYSEQRAVWRKSNEPKPIVDKPVAESREVPLEDVLKRTKTGQWNTQSTLGKVVALLDSCGFELRAWRSPVAYGIGAAHHGKRVFVNGARIRLNGREVTLDELKGALL